MNSSRWILGCLLTLWFFIGHTAQAQSPVIITGDAPFAKNEEIRLIVIDDLINGIPRVVATDKIDRTGRFALKYQTNRIQPVQLAIRTSKAEFFVAPSITYNLHLSVDSLLFGLINPETYGGMLHIVNAKPDTNDINLKINRFDRYFNELMDTYAFQLVYDRSTAAYDTMMQQLQQRFPVRYDPLNYYQSYIYYTCGVLDQLCFPKDATRIYIRYFDNDYILYNNPAYISMFIKQYGGYLYSSKHISKSMLNQAINEQPDYLTLFNEVGRDPLLVNERVRELVLILNLIEFYNHEEFDRGNVVQLLRYILQTTHFPEHTVFIENALARFTNDNPSGAKLTLTNEKGKKVSLKPFGENPIYVHIFQSDCIDCIREMQLIHEFVKKYGQKITFLSLNVDADFRQYEQFCKKYGSRFDWPTLYFNGSYDWLDEQGIETLPDYFIMNTDGHILNRYVPSPERGLSEFLRANYSDEEPAPSNPFMQRDK